MSESEYETWLEAAAAQRQMLDHTAARERCIKAKHTINLLVARALYSGTQPSAKQWAAAFRENREAKLALVMVQNRLS